jgi:hypothetical protein
MEVLRLSVEKSGPPQRLVSTSREWESSVVGPPLELPDGRGVLLPAKPLGHSRLLVVGRDVPDSFLSDDREEANGPCTLVGERGLAYLTGPRGSRRVKLVEVEKDRIRTVHTFKSFSADGLASLVAAPDGNKLYFVRRAEAKVEVVEVPARDREEQPPQFVADGNGLAVHPKSGELLIQRFRKAGVRLYRLPKGETEPVEVPVMDKSPEGRVLRMSASALGDRAIHPDGRVLVSVTFPDSWFWGMAVLKPDDGTLTPLPVVYDGDLMTASWGRDGKSVLATGFPLRSELWCFTPPK